MCAISGDFNTLKYGSIKFKLSLVGTKEDYVENSIEDSFDDLGIGLRDMLSYFNLIK